LADVSSLGISSFYIELCHMLKKGQAKYGNQQPNFEQFYALAA
jgi:hypothetical protein